MNLWEEVAASSLAGATATVLGHPLDCVKVRMQVLTAAGLTNQASSSSLVEHTSRETKMARLGNGLSGGRSLPRVKPGTSAWACAAHMLRAEGVRSFFFGTSCWCCC